jgi:hypothetical protein
MMNCESTIGKCEDISPEQIYTLILHDLVGKDIEIRVTESRLSSVIHILSKSFFIEIS